MNSFDVEQFSTQLQYSLREMNAILSRSMKNGKYSVVLVFDLALNHIMRTYNVYSIIDEIACLEGSSQRPSQTKPATKFTRWPLKGLWHKHHFQARFIAKNLVNEMDRNKTIEEIFDRRSESTISENFINEIVHEAINRNFERRSQSSRLTGEWIIFRKKENHNEYILLSDHKQKDEVIASRIEMADKFGYVRSAEIEWNIKF